LAERLQDTYSKTVSRYEKQIAFVADKVGDKGVADLERLATALFLTLSDKAEAPRHRANKLSKLKPHISPSRSLEAVQEVGKIVAEAQQIPKS